jgi:hypothetical protein
MARQILYHGTTPEAAREIERNGFRLPAVAPANGPGIYLTHSPEIARSYGPHVVAVQVTGKIASGRTSEDAAYEGVWNKSYKKDPKFFSHDGDAILQEAGFKGKTDEDGAKVIFDPSHVQFVSHHTPLV